MDCVFCRMPPELYLLENEHFFAIRDTHPVSKGHCLIVSRRHIENFFQLNPAEMQALQELSCKMREYLEVEFTPDGYNLGMNCGSAAGQSVFHYHLHFIPRYSRDRKRIQGLREYLKEIL